MRKICICGHFGIGLNMLNGQTIKTKIVEQELRRRYGEKEIYIIDTHGKKNLILMFFRLIYALATCENVIILPAYGGVKIIPFWLRIWNFLFQRSLHYIVIGGWLAGYIDKYIQLRWALRSFRNIFVETSTMKKNLMHRGYDNVSVLLNCKPLDIVDKKNIIYETEHPLRLVTFSRVMEKKGIGELARIVNEINADSGSTVFTLDIYGQVDSRETEWFANLQKSFTNAIKYKGSVEYSKSVEILKTYFALVFPTRFFTEGVPGTIIDAYASALPVISSRWESFADIIDEGKTGIGYTFDDFNELKSLLRKIASNPAIINEMRENCILKAVDYLPINAMAHMDF